MLFPTWLRNGEIHCTKKWRTYDLFSKCAQIRSFLRIWSHLLKKSLMGNFIFLQWLHRTELCRRSSLGRLKSFFIMLIWQENNDNTFTVLKSDSHLPKKLCYLLHWKTFKNHDKCFLFHLKISFRFQDIKVFVMTFWSCRKNGLIWKIILTSKFMTSQPV